MPFCLKTIYIILTLSLSLLYTQKLSGQQLISEPAGGMDERELLAASKGLPLSMEKIPDILTIPPLVDYYNSWDTLHVRRYSEEYPKIDNVITLPLFNEYSKGFVFPIEGDFLSPFGYRGRRVHSGVDIKLNAGDTVVSAFDGVVRMARYYAGYGNCVVIRHYNGLETLYAHLSKLKVNPHQVVKAGELVGLGGRTGRATCNHLHFETRFQGRAFNPKQIFNMETFSLLADTLKITPLSFGLSRDYIPDADIVASGDFSVIKEKENLRKLSFDSKKASKYHKIKKGETLSAISRKHGTTVDKICKLNGIKPAKILKPGINIRVK